MKVALNNNIIKYGLPVCIYALFIFILSSMSYPPSPSRISNILFLEKLEHLFLYFGFGLILYIAINNSNNLFFQKFSAQISILIGTVYGITDEIHQFFVPCRDASVLDVIVDGCGVALAQALIILIGRLKKS